MNIRDLRDGMRTVNVEGEILDIGEARSVSLRTGAEAKVADATLKDASGTVKLSVWDNQIDQISRGDHVRIKNGYVNTFRGELQLNIGRFGNMEIV